MFFIATMRVWQTNELQRTQAIGMSGNEPFKANIMIVIISQNI